jgi:hypothetical protein
MGFYTGPNIVTNGLVLSLDAANTKSYQSGSTTWFDKSGNAKNGTLISGSTYSSANGGSIVFDGVDDIINFGTGSNFFPLPQFTIDIWFKSLGTVPTTGTTPGLFGFTYGIRCYLNATSMTFSVDNGTDMSGVSVSDTFRSDNKWYNATFYHTGTNMGIYINGVFGNSTNGTWSGTSRWPTDTWNLGRDNNNTSQFYPGHIASCKIYNKVLTASEILQNYNATKTRFDL